MKVMIGVFVLVVFAAFIWSPAVAYFAERSEKWEDELDRANKDFSDRMEQEGQ